MPFKYSGLIILFYFIHITHTTERPDASFVTSIIENDILESEIDRLTKEILDLKEVNESTIKDIERSKHIIKNDLNALTQLEDIKSAFNDHSITKENNGIENELNEFPEMSKIKKQIAIEDEVNKLKPKQLQKMYNCIDEEISSIICLCKHFISRHFSVYLRKFEIIFKRWTT